MSKKQTENEKAWYSPFVKKSAKVEAKNKRKEFNKKRDEFFDSQRKSGGTKKYNSNFEGKRKLEFDAKYENSISLFDFEKLPKDAVAVLSDFDKIVQGVRPLNSKQIQNLPKDIRTLSHQLTDERSDRRGGYMNKTQELSAYSRYFLWWNLVRLTRLFANLPESAFLLKDGDVILDIGSGPLSVVIALWLSRPELRNKKLTCYCMDISASSMALGEDLFLSVASKALPSEESAGTWKIIRVKGEIGTEIRKKANFVSCANMFNELCQKNTGSIEDLASKQLETLLSYGDERSSFFIAEPGMPESGYFINLLRTGFLKKNCKIVSPCVHASSCPMNGKYARYGGKAKWCNFSFTTEDAPKELLKRSEQAGLPKERAVISYLFVNKNSLQPANIQENNALFRIVSDEIRLSDGSSAFYACGKKGFVVCVNNSKLPLKSGDAIFGTFTTAEDSLEKDSKTSGVKVRI